MHFFSTKYEEPENQSGWVTFQTSHSSEQDCIINSGLSQLLRLQNRETESQAWESSSLLNLEGVTVTLNSVTRFDLWRCLWDPREQKCNYSLISLGQSIMCSGGRTFPSNICTPWRMPMTLDEEISQAPSYSTWPAYLPSWKGYSRVMKREARLGLREAK